MKTAEPYEKTTLDFVYVNANIGEAAGGHTAIRLGSDIFHFQFFPDGKFLLVRESWSHFRYIYNELRNRTIFVSQITLAPETFETLKNHFTQQLVIQQKKLNVLQSVERERALLTQLDQDETKLRLDTVGLFDFNGAEDESIRQLQTTIQSVLGDEFLRQRRLQLEKELAQYKFSAGSHLMLENWVSVLQELLLEQAFFRILDEKVPLAQASVLETSIGNQEDLTEAQRLVLSDYRDQLTLSIAGLIKSRRPDRTRALLLQTARYLVVNHSLVNNKLFTLDPFSSRSNIVNAPDQTELQGLHRQLHQNAIQASEDFYQATDHINIAYTILESAFGRLFELENALRNGGQIRVEAGVLLPQREGYVGVNFSSDLPQLSMLLVETEQQALTLRRQIEAQYFYHLISRNCATELIRTLNAAFVDQSIGLSELGGWLEPNERFIFIPYQFYNQVNSKFPVIEQAIFTSRRLRQLDEMQRWHNKSQLWLNESNILASTLYRHRVEDTYFLMFTDDTLLLRPVYGAVNLIWGAINSVIGLLSFPIDDGTRFYQGTRGMFYSLPELMFGNVRKGTYGFAQMETVGP